MVYTVYKAAAAAGSPKQACFGCALRPQPAGDPPSRSAASHRAQAARTPRPPGSSPRIGGAPVARLPPPPEAGLFFERVPHRGALAPASGNFPAAAGFSPEADSAMIWRFLSFGERTTSVPDSHGPGSTRPRSSLWHLSRRLLPPAAGDDRLLHRGRRRGGRGGVDRRRPRGRHSPYPRRGRSARRVLQPRPARRLLRPGCSRGRRPRGPRHLRPATRRDPCRLGARRPLRRPGG